MLNFFAYIFRRNFCHCAWCHVRGLKRDMIFACWGTSFCNADCEREDFEARIW